MPWYPDADLLISLPHWGYPKGVAGQNKPKAVVHHIAEGSFNTLISRSFWDTRNGGTGGSVHFAVALDGRVAQLVDTDNAAYGNGFVNNSTWEPALSGNPNLFTISIEHEGFTGNPWPEAMYQASLKLTRWLLDTYNLEVGPDTLIGHYRIDGVNRVNCPGKGWPLARFMVDLAPVVEEDPLAGFTDEEKQALHELAAIHLVGKTFAPGVPGRSFLIALMDAYKAIPADRRDETLRRSGRFVSRIGQDLTTDAPPSTTRDLARELSLPADG